MEVASEIGTEARTEGGAQSCAVLVGQCFREGAHIAPGESILSQQQARPGNRPRQQHRRCEQIAQDASGVADADRLHDVEGDGLMLDLFAGMPDDELLHQGVHLVAQNRLGEGDRAEQCGVVLGARRDGELQGFRRVTRKQSQHAFEALEEGPKAVALGLELQVPMLVLPGMHGLLDREGACLFA